MDRIEPISPSPRAIAPIDATGVKVRPTSRQKDSEEREQARRRAEAERRAKDEGDDGEGGEQPHIDLRV